MANLQVYTGNPTNHTTNQSIRKVVLIDELSSLSSADTPRLSSAGTMMYTEYFRPHYNWPIH